MKYLTARKNKKRIDFELPTRVGELEWGQAKALIELDTEDREYTLKMVSALTKVEEAFWRDSQDVDTYLRLAVECQTFMNSWVSEFVDWTERPSNPTVEVDGQVVEMPEDIGYVSVGQYQDSLALASAYQKSLRYSEEELAEMDLAEDEEEPVKQDMVGAFFMYEKLFKVYLYPLLSGGVYDYAESQLISIDQIPFEDVIKWSYFFLTSPTGLKGGTQGNARKVRTPKKRFKQVMKRFLKSSGSGQR